MKGLSWCAIAILLVLSFHRIYSGVLNLLNQDISLRRIKAVSQTKEDLIAQVSRGLRMDISNSLGKAVFRLLSQEFGEEPASVKIGSFLRSHPQLEHPLLYNIFLRNGIPATQIRDFIQPHLDFYFKTTQMKLTSEQAIKIEGIIDRIFSGIRGFIPEIVGNEVIRFMVEATDEARELDPRLLRELKLSPEEESILRQRLAVIRAISRSVGDDFDLKIAVGRQWAYDFETNTVTYPVEELLKDEVEISVAKAIHEGGHREISRVIDREFTFGTQSHRLLYNGLEDPRVNNWEMHKYLGVKQSFMVPLYKKIWPEVPENRVYNDLEVLPHLQFIYGLIYHWANGKENPAIKNPTVLDALTKAQQAAQKIYKTLPTQAKQANELQVKEAAQKVERIIKEEIWPIYKELIEESAKVVEKGLKEGKLIPLPQPPGEGKRPDALSPEELSAEARKIVEEASEDLADKLEGGIERPDLKEAQKHLWDKKHPPHKEAERARKESLLGKLLRTQSEFEEFKKSITSPYDVYLGPIAKMVEQLVGYLDNILQLDIRPKLVGYYDTGIKFSIHRIMQRLGQGSPERDVFLHRTSPQARSHKFSLVIDESGSMTDGIKDVNAMRALTLFIEVLEWLGIDNNIMGFSSGEPILHKDFGKTTLMADEKDEIIEQIKSAMGGGATYDAEALETAIEKIMQQPGETRIIIVLTDGEGNGPKANEMPRILEQAQRKGIKVIGVGIGAGITYVKKVYGKNAIQVDNIEDLPLQVSRILEREILGR
jgi:hypothetical protein